jgi:hydrogenase nickel incorporation protein HypA/HybF
MHEMGIAEATLEMVLQAASGTRVKRVRLRIGQCLLVVPDAFRFSFELASAGTEAAGAELEFQETPAVLRCRQCGKEAEATAGSFLCQNCASPDIDVIAGEEMSVEEIELEDGTTLHNRNVAAAEALAEHFREQGPHEH